MTTTADLRVTQDMFTTLESSVHYLANSHMYAGLIKANSWSMTVLVAQRPGANFVGAVRHQTGRSREHEMATNGMDWYTQNVEGKEMICLETGMDSHEAVALWPGLVAHLEGGFPWGGGIIDANYGLIICTSGFLGDEDLMVSRHARNYLVMMMDRVGTAVLNDARQRGDQEGDAAADRFTKLPSPEMVDRATRPHKQVPSANEKTLSGPPDA